MRVIAAGSQTQNPSDRKTSTFSISHPLCEITPLPDPGRTEFAPQGAIESGNIHNEVIHLHRRASEHGNVPEHRDLQVPNPEELAECLSAPGQGHHKLLRTI